MTNFSQEDLQNFCFSAIHTCITSKKGVRTEVKMMAILRIYGASVEQNQKRLKRRLIIP